MKIIPFLRPHIGHLLYLVNRGGYAVLPHLIVLEISNRCNLRCKMCWWNFDRKEKAKDELTFEEIKKLVGEIKAFRPNITITGAEPFFRKDTAKILLYMADKRLPIRSIFTNGTLVNQESAEAIVKAGVELVQVSIDGDKDTHEKIRGAGGCYDKAIRGIKLIQSVIREKGENSKTDIRINCVISSDNLHCLDSLVDLAEGLNVQLQFQHLMWLNKEQIDRHEDFLRERFDFEDTTIKNLENNLQSLDLRLLEEKLRKIEQECQKRGIPLYFLQFSDKETIKKWYTDLSFVPREYCFEPFLAARITSNGDLKFCPLIDYSYGNVKFDNFETLWKGVRAKDIRSELRRKSLFPGCIRCCKL